MNHPVVELLWPPLRVPAAWSARWIAAPEVKRRPNAVFRARQRVELGSVPESLVLHVSAESTYRLHINGVQIGRGPARGTRTVCFFDSYEIGPLLRPGANWIAADVHCHNRPTSQANPAEPGLFIQSDDGRIATDASWQAQAADEWRSDVPVFSFQIGYMEWQDLRGEPRGWQVGRDETAWKSPAILSSDEKVGGKRLLPRDVPAMQAERCLPVDVRPLAATPPLESVDDVEVAKRVSEEQHLPLHQVIDCTPLTRQADQAVVIDPPPDGGGVALLADFRTEVNGGFSVELDAPAGTIVDVGYEEELTNGRLVLTAFVYRFADRYILREGRQTIGNAFASRGFRVVQVVLRSFNRPVRIHGIRGTQRRYPYPRRASFTCSDAVLNQIWSTCVETMSACTTDTLVDCPWRENTLYLNDMLVENVTSLQAFGDPRLNARCFRLAASQPRPNGLLPGAVPSALMPGIDDPDASADRIVLLASNLFLANMLEEHLRYTGDEKLVREMIGPLLRILDTVAGWEDSDGVIHAKPQYWNFIDWSYPDAENGQKYAAPLNWFYAWSLVATARLLKMLGEPRDPEPFRRRAERLAGALDRRFWNPRRKCYVECEDEPDGLASQLTHAVAVLSGLLPADRESTVAAALGREDLLEPELYMQHLVLRALVKRGKPERALDRIRRYWGPIVLSGSPTVGECAVHQKHAKTSFFGAASLCHGFSTTPIDYFQSVILGVRPVETGFRRCTVRPFVDGVEHASGSVPTPAGNLYVSWQRSGDGVVLDLRVPGGIVAELIDGRELVGGQHRVEFDLIA